MTYPTPAPTPSPSQGIGEPAFPPGTDYVPDAPIESTQTPAPLPPDNTPDLAVTGGDSFAALWLAVTLIAAGATLALVARIRKGRAS